jgi:hypothetical protein
VLCDNTDMMYNASTNDHDNAPSLIQLEFCRMQSQRLLQLMGGVCSHLVWLYATKENESAQSVAELMANTIQTALEEAESSSTRSQDWDRVKLRLVLDLDKSVCPRLRPALAARLGVARLYNTIFGVVHMTAKWDTCLYKKLLHGFIHHETRKTPLQRKKAALQIFEGVVGLDSYVKFVSARGKRYTCDQVLGGIESQLNGEQDSA